MGIKTTIAFTKKVPAYHAYCEAIERRQQPLWRLIGNQPQTPSVVLRAPNRAVEKPEKLWRRCFWTFEIAQHTIPMQVD